MENTVGLVALIFVLLLACVGATRIILWVVEVIEHRRERERVRIQRFGDLVERVRRLESKKIEKLEFKTLSGLDGHDRAFLYASTGEDSWMVPTREKLKGSWQPWEEIPEQSFAAALDEWEQTSRPKASPPGRKPRSKRSK